MKLKATLALGGLAFLTACGGGGGGGVDYNNLNAQPTVLKTFSDGSGVAGVTVIDSNTSVTMNVMRGDIQSYQPTSTSVADVSNMVYQSSTQYGSLYSGPVTVNGVLYNALGFVDSTSGVTILYGANATENALGAGGLTATNIPSGAFRYTGTNFIGYRDGSYFEDGTFAMNVDFTNGTGAITGSTATSTMGGVISVNTSSGTFSGSNLTINNVPYNLSATGSINGNFHNDSATGVTGIYYDNGSNPVVAGAIAGSR